VDPSFVINGKNRIERGFQDSAFARLAFAQRIFRPFSFGDVARNLGSADYPAVESWSGDMPSERHRLCERHFSATELFHNSSSARPFLSLSRISPPRLAVPAGPTN